MSMKINESAESENVFVEMSERFDFSKQAEFRQLYENKPTSTHFVLDFSKTQHIDSAALGMLLLLREYLNDNAGQIQLVNCSNEIKKILAICHFESMFDIS